MGNFVIAYLLVFVLSVHLHPPVFCLRSNGDYGSPLPSGNENRGRPPGTVTFSPLRVPPASSAGLPPHLRLGLLPTPQVDEFVASRRLALGGDRSMNWRARQVRIMIRSQRGVKYR